ncbi:MAG: 50S ribosomal protein L32 [Bacteriovoracales bacterium]|nr:50S ribosomal protein L32 [Bacteriovoracales bacterium]
MAVPKKRTSVRRKGLRRAGHTHKLYANVPTMKCPNCQSLTVKHHLCPSCGHYRGRAIIEVASPQDAEEGGHEKGGDESR